MLVSTDVWPLLDLVHLLKKYLEVTISSFKVSGINKKEDNNYSFISAGLNIQVRFILNSNCGDYVQSETMAKTNDITNQLSVGVEHLCGCGFNYNLLSDQFIRCFDDSPQHVTYRAVLTGAPTISTVELASLVNQWIRDSGRIVVQSAQFTLSNDCPLVIADVAGPECPGDLTNRTASETSNGNTVNIGAVVGGVVSDVLALVITVVLAAVVVVLAIRYRRSRSKHINAKVDNCKPVNIK